LKSLERWRDELDKLPAPRNDNRSDFDRLMDHVGKAAQLDEAAAAGRHRAARRIQRQAEAAQSRKTEVTLKSLAKKTADLIKRSPPSVKPDLATRAVEVKT